MNTSSLIKKELNKYINPEKAEFLPRFFKCRPGEYGEGDKFLGIVVPDQRKVVKKYLKEAMLEDVNDLINEEYHEYRLTGFLLLVAMYENEKDPDIKNTICSFYIENLKKANNWDLVDLTAHKILGAHLYNKKRDLLLNLAESENLWEQRVSIISTYYFIKRNEFEDTFSISEKLIDHKHDLIHKAVGWMLREVGKIDIDAEKKFLNKHYKTMPRTMLRYAIEKFEKGERLKYLKGEI